MSHRGHRGPAPRRGERGSLPLAMLVVIVAGGLVALLVPMLTVQITSTSFGQSRTHELNAAQAGLNAALGAIQSAADIGDVPCGPDAVTGAVDDSGDSPTFRAAVDYYLTDPAGKDAAWLAGNKLPCPLAEGTAPQFALFRSTGSDARAQRTVQSVYALVSGGTIYLWTTRGARLCIDAGIDAGATLAARPCVTNPSTGQPAPTADQIWVYASDGTIKRVASDAALCLTAAGSTVALAACDSTRSIQRWVLGDAVGRIESAALAGRCMAVTDPAAGGALMLAACSGDVAADVHQRWMLAPSVGAGSAAGDSGPSAFRQYVNFQTSRCIDSTGDGSYLTARMCRTIDGAVLAASSQGVAFGAGSTVLKVVTGAGEQCLRSPDTADPDPAAGPWVTLGPCTGSTTWIVGRDDHTIRPAGRSDLCLSLTTSTLGYADGFPKLLVETCDGSMLQAWAPRSDRSGFADLQEIAGPGA